MASSAPSADFPTNKSKSLLARVAAFGVHTVAIYVLAVRVSPMLVGFWFRWLAPIFSTSINEPSADWYLQHMEIVTIIPALILGYVNVIRILPATVGGNMGESKFDSVSVWAWFIPTLVLIGNMLLYRPATSVLYSNSMSAIRYFFEIEPVMPTLRNLLEGSPSRVLAQMFVTAPFYAGVAYSASAWTAKNALLGKLFRFEKHEGIDTEAEI